MGGRVGRQRACRRERVSTGGNQRIGGEMGWKRKNGIRRARAAVLSKKVTGKERGKGEGWRLGGQKTHDGGLGYVVA